MTLNSMKYYIEIINDIVPLEDVLQSFGRKALVRTEASVNC